MANLGKKGESLALSFLEEKGYAIEHHNYRYGRSEIDLIARFQNTLVFVEVKSRSNLDYGFPESFVSKSQEKRIMEAAEQYILDTNWEGNIRFDIISVETKPTLKITHFEDAILPYS